MSPQLFIGSSVENLTLAFAIQENLAHDAESTVWTQGVFALSATSIDSLLERVAKTDFAVFVFAPNDVTKLRDKHVQTVRDNVVFELGLFIGRLGKERTYIVAPRDRDGLHFPTDTIGMTPASYDPNRSDQNWTAALGPACHQIRIMMGKNGKRPESRLLQNRAATSPLTDDEIVAVLQSWMGARTEQQNREVIYFAKVDEELNLPPRSAEKHLEIAAKRYDLVVEKKGPNLILFRRAPTPPSSFPQW